MLDEFDRQRIRKFKESKASLESLRRLFESEEPDSELAPSQALSQFLTTKLSQNEGLREVLLSRKMKMQNKIMLIKYMEMMRKGIGAPSNFKKWKNNRN